IRARPVAGARPARPRPRARPRASSGGTASRVPALAGLAGEELDGVGEHRQEDLQRFAHRARRPWEIDDERRADRARDAARQHAVGRLRERARAQRFGDARDLAVDDAARGIGGDVVRREAGATAREDDVRARTDRVEDRVRDLRDVVGDERAAHDGVTGGRERLPHGRSALVRALSRGAAGAHGDDAGADLRHGARYSPLRPPLFATRRTSVSFAPRSTALSMSYRVRPATVTAVSASISTPVGAVVPTVASMAMPSLSIASSTLACDSGSGWQSGMRSGVRFAAMIPAMRAAPSTSPFGARPSRTRSSVAFDTRSFP